MLIKTTDLTPGERLAIDRRRIGRSQQAQAGIFGVSLYKYRKWENDEEEPPNDPPLGNLQTHEQCYVVRRRRGLRLGDVAVEMGFSRWWINQMELGEVNCGKLHDYFAQ